MLFLLTKQYYDEFTVMGVFTSVENAKEFLETKLMQQNLKWSNPEHNIHGTISAGGFVIQSVELDPTNLAHLRDI